MSISGEMLPGNTANGPIHRRTFMHYFHAATADTIISFALSQTQRKQIDFWKFNFTNRTSFCGLCFRNASRQSQLEYFLGIKEITMLPNCFPSSVYQRRFRIKHWTRKQKHLRLWQRHAAHRNRNFNIGEQKKLYRQTFNSKYTSWLRYISNCLNCNIWNVYALECKLYKHILTRGGSLCLFLTPFRPNEAQCFRSYTG